MISNIGSLFKFAIKKKATVLIKQSLHIQKYTLSNPKVLSSTFQLRNMVFEQETHFTNSLS